jgi:hypothetical protein
MNLEAIRLNFQGIANSTFAIVVENKYVYSYDKEKKAYTDQIVGNRITVVLPQQSYEKMDVLLPVGGVPQDVISGAKVEFEGFEARIVHNFHTGELGLSCKAAKAMIVK